MVDNEKDYKSKSMTPYISLCIPTNGVIKWVKPVLDSIYEQNVKVDLFEVIVTDNGTDEDFQNLMLTYEKRYSNFVYKKTTAKQFLNQIEAFKLAKGFLIKFINHRMVFLPGSLQYFLDFVEKNIETMPGIYFLNQANPKVKKECFCENFDEYMNTLSYFSSWSAGTAIWKKDFDNFDLTKKFDLLFPHIDLIIANKKKETYIVDNTKLLETIPADNTIKGKYDLFFAFSVEYIQIILNLVITKDISWKTFYKIKEDTEKFIARQYLEFVLKKKKCSYDVSGFSKAVNVFYSTKKIRVKAVIILLQDIIRKILP